MYGCEEPVDFDNLVQPFEAEAPRDNIYESSPYLKENTALHHYRQLTNAVQGNNRCFQWRRETSNTRLVENAVSDC
jgi:hypothetical protein